MSRHISNFPISKSMCLSKWTSSLHLTQEAFSRILFKTLIVHSKFVDWKPNQIPPLGIRVEPDLQAVGYKKQDTLQYLLPADPPWLLKWPHVNFSLHSSYKEDTPPEIFLNKFYELYDEYKGFCRLYTDGSLMENRVACAVVISRTSAESVSTTQQY